MDVFSLILVIFAAAACLCLVASYFVFALLCLRHRRSEPFSIARHYPEPRAEGYRDRIRAAHFYLQELKREFIVLVSDDGIELAGWYYPAKTSTDKNILFCHGWHSNAANDFALIAHYYVEHGFNILLIEQRAHGMSAGKYTTFGAKERYDCLIWARYLANRQGEQAKIVLSGLSMGAATVLSVASMDMPPQVCCVVADCGFTSIRDEMPVGFRVFKIPFAPIKPFASFWCRVLAGFSISTPGPVDTLGAAKVPVLLIHGSKDSFVPTEMSYRNKEVCPTCDTLLVVDGAAHGGSYLLAPLLYEQTLDSFYERTLGQ